MRVKHSCFPDFLWSASLVVTEQLYHKTGKILQYFQLLPYAYLPFPPLISIIFIMTGLSKTFTDSDKSPNSAAENFYLARSYRASDPYALITDLPFEEADRISQENYPQRSPNYMHDRYAVDDWLREQAKAAGVETDRHNPVSFSVIKDIEQWKRSLHPNDGQIVIPFKDIDLRNWSFTLDDSFVSTTIELESGEWTKRYPASDLHGRVFNGIGMTDILNNGQFPDETVNGNPRYFEAQLWADIPTLLKSANINQVEATFSRAQPTL